MILFRFAKRWNGGLSDALILHIGGWFFACAILPVQRVICLAATDKIRKRAGMRANI